MIKVIGLTGGIASGKSQVAKILKENGVEVIDADQLSRKLLDENHSVKDQVMEYFGTLDRNLIRKKIFQESVARKKLESILHPEIRRQSEIAFKKAENSGKKFAVYEAALLIETKWTPQYGHLDGLLVVMSTIKNRLARLAMRDQSKFVDPKILESQCSDQERTNEATWIIENNGTLEELKNKTLQWLEEIGKASLNVSN